MKKLLPLLISITFFTAKAQTTKPINSFLGVKLGSAPATVVAALKLKGCTLDKKNSTANMLVFDNVKLAGREPAYLSVNFIDNKANRATFVFKPELEAKTIDYYNELVNDINKIYGEGEVKKEFKEPYEEGDGYETTAIQSGNAKYGTYWGFNDEKQPGSIITMITDKLSVILSYYDKKLSGLESKRNEQKNNADF